MARSTWVMKGRRLTSVAGILAGLALTGLAVTGCSSTLQNGQSSGTPASQRAEINAGADATLSRLYQTSPDARQLVQRAKGVLIFPSLIKAGFVVGGEYGRGVLRVGGRPEAYYSTAAGSIGFQAGAQSSASVLLFMTDDALDKFRNSNGWTAGADATVTIARVGANGSLDTNTIQQPIIGFVLSNVGLMAGVSLEGAKITRLPDL